MRLIRTPRIGPVTFHELLARYGTASQAIEALPDLAKQARNPLRIPSRNDAEREIATATKAGAQILTLRDPAYPAHLRQTDTPPPVLSVLGDTASPARPAVAIVGARNASAAGTRMARQLATELGRAGMVVVSGLARGIDAAAHQGALETGTVAVLAGGLDRPYPSENIPLMREIAAKGGAVISEMPWGWEPRAQDFPRRNRIVAGLSLGLLVVEAAMSSGSLISARLANELGRLVFAVPGSPLDPRAAGTNKLLKDGAVLVTEVADILDQLGTQITRAPIPTTPNSETAQRSFFTEAITLPPLAPEDGSVNLAVQSALSPVPTSIDELVAHTGLNAAQIRGALLELDLAGRLERHSNGGVSLVAIER
nr:DNA-processing protein DprA [Mesorhizobium liriopis]